MVEVQEPEWLLLDGYEDEPAAFGVPPYIGFHCRYIAGVFEHHRIPYRYLTIDQWRQQGGADGFETRDLAGLVILAGAVVPGKYLRGTPVSLREVDRLIGAMPAGSPILCGGWAVRGWRNQGWGPLRRNLFLSLWDADAALDHFLARGEWKNLRRDAEQWERFALAGAASKAVSEHPDLGGPLTFEVEVYQGCVRFKNGCKFCIEPKKGIPLWRSPDAVIAEVRAALDCGVEHVRLGGMTDVYSYLAEGVADLEYPIPDPGPLASLLHGLRDDGRIDTLHVDNANPSIIAENPEPSVEITKLLVETLSDGAVLSFGLESVDAEVHTANWLNCNPQQAKDAIRMINKYGRERGKRGLPKLLPGLNFIAGLHGEVPERTYRQNMDFLLSLRDAGLWLRRINIRQVEGEGFQQIPKEAFQRFKQQVRDEIDAPLLAEMLPVGQRLNAVHWESHDVRTRLPAHLGPEHRDRAIHGRPGVTFGRQIGAYPILVGVTYHIPLETMSDVIVTSHGKRSITAVECALDVNTATQRQFEAVPGIGRKTAWNLVSARARASRDDPDQPAFESATQAFESIDAAVPELTELVFSA